MKNLIPEFKTKTERIAFLRSNKSQLIAQKRSLPTISDDLEFGYSKHISSKTMGTKSDAVVEEEPGELTVDIVANLSGWCDSQMDVMMKDSWKKSITDLSASGQRLIYHLKNHDYNTDSIIGKKVSLYAKDLDMSMFNIVTDIKKAQALITTSTVCEDYDEKAFNLYQDGEAKQHSISLQYIQIVLCLDSTEPEDVAEKKNWDKYYPTVINKDKVDNYGYFWAVIEAKILETSLVLWGANILTPVLTTGQPSTDTGEQPPKSTAITEENSHQKSIIGCPACDYLFVANNDGLSKCPNCGQFCSPQSTTIMMSAGNQFDFKKAIEETIFI